MTPNAERLSRGEDVGVDVGAIEREFASLWRSASADGAADKAVTRACMANLLVWCEDDAQMAALKNAFDTLVVSVPARVLILKVEDAREDEKEFESYISANCIVAPGGGKLVCSEEVTLLARGAGVAHLGSVVRALLVPNVPTMLFLPRAPGRAVQTVLELLRLSDRLLLDTAAVEDPAELARLTALCDSGVPMVDLGWMGLAGLRNSLAAVFDHEGPRMALRGLKALTLRAPLRRLSSRLLLLGWLADRLALTEHPTLDVQRGDSRVLSHGSVKLEVTTLHAGSNGVEPATTLQMQLADQDVTLTRGSEPYAFLQTLRGLRKMALDPSTLGDRIARAMGPRAFDPAFPAVFARTRQVLRATGLAP